MAEQTSIIRLDALRAAPVNPEPFPYAVVPDFLSAACASAVIADFPSIHYRGSFPVAQLQGGATFAQLVEEWQGDEVRAALQDKFDVDLTDSYTLVTVRGWSQRRDGHIHTDAKSKLLTLLLYLNPGWQDAGGRLRILYNKRSLDDYAAEVVPTFGTCLMFKVTDNCWHGHTPFIGQRRVLQLNYIRDESARNRHLLRHGLTARLKGLRQRLTSGGR
jgi:SM-20-related protein